MFENSSILLVEFKKNIPCGESGTPCLGKTTLLYSTLLISPLSLNREGCWGTTDDFATSFLYFSLFSAVLWDLANSRPVHSLMLSSHLFLCLPCLLPPSPCLARWFWPDLMKRRHDHTTAVCVSLRSSGLRVVQLPAGSWHGPPRW